LPDDKKYEALPLVWLVGCVPFSAVILKDVSPVNKCSSVNPQRFSSGTGAGKPDLELADPASHG